MWLDETKEYLKMNLVMDGLVKKFEVSGKKGDIFHVPNVTALTVNNKTAATAVVLSAPTETEFTITINTHKHIAWLIEDMAETQSKYDLRNEYTRGAGYELAKVIDTALLALYGSFTSSITGGATITDANLIKAVEQLDLLDVAGSERSLVIRPTQKSAFFNLDKFYRADFRGGTSSVLSGGVGTGGSLEGGMGVSGTGKAKFGDIYGVNVYVSRNVPLSTTYRNQMFEREAISLAIQKSPRIQSAYKLEFLANLVVMDVIYGTAIFRADAGTQITTTS